MLGASWFWIESEVKEFLVLSQYILSFPSTKQFALICSIFTNLETAWLWAPNKKYDSQLTGRRTKQIDWAEKFWGADAIQDLTDKVTVPESVYLGKRKLGTYPRKATSLALRHSGQGSVWSCGDKLGNMSRLSLPLREKIWKFGFQ